MSQEAKKLGSTDVAIRFSSGTTLQGLGGDGLVHSRRPPPGRLRSARLPVQLDTSPQFEAALSELGIVEQDTVAMQRGEKIRTPMTVRKRNDGEIASPGGR
jgi:hypothetical protein